MGNRTPWLGFDPQQKGGRVYTHNLNFELFIVTFDRGISALRGGVQSMNLVGVYPQIYTARHIRDAPRPSLHAEVNF